MPSLLQFDMALRSWIVLHRVSILDTPMLIVSTVTRVGALWLVAAAALAIAKRISWGNFGRLVLTLALGGILTEYVVKPAVHRARPYVTSPTVAVIGEPPGGYSFPSGQTTSAFAAALVLTKAAPATSIVWWIVAVSVAYSRVYVGVHYPLDVVAGAAFGILIAALVLTLTSRDTMRTLRDS